MCRRSHSPGPNARRRRGHPHTGALSAVGPGCGPGDGNPVPRVAPSGGARLRCSDPVCSTCADPFGSHFEYHSVAKQMGEFPMQWTSRFFFVFGSLLFSGSGLMFVVAIFGAWNLVQSGERCPEDTDRTAERSGVWSAAGCCFRWRGQCSPWPRDYPKPRIAPRPGEHHTRPPDRYPFPSTKSTTQHPRTCGPGPRQWARMSTCACRTPRPEVRPPEWASRRMTAALG